MKNIITILLITASLNASSQFATKQYVDSLYHTLDSVIVKPNKVTLTSSTINLDTLSIPNNTASSFQILVQTDSDNTIKLVYIKNIGGLYSIIDDSDIKPFSHNRKSSIFSSTILYQISSTLSSNKVIIQAKGKTNTVMNWKLSRTIL